MRVICACIPQLPGSHLLGVLVPSLEVQFPKAFLQTSKEELGSCFEVFLGKSEYQSCESEEVPGEQSHC